MGEKSDNFHNVYGVVLCGVHMCELSFELQRLWDLAALVVCGKGVNVISKQVNHVDSECCNAGMCFFKVILGNAVTRVYALFFVCYP